MQIDNLTKYGAEFQIKCVSSLLSDKSFVERVYEILDPKIFESDANQWIVEQIKDYFVQYKDLPTPTVFKYKVDELTKSIGNDKKAELLKSGIVTQLRSVYQKTTESDIKFIKDEFLTFCVNRSMKNAVLESADLVKSGEYTKIRTVIENALKAGMEKDLGHDYVNDVEERLSDMARACIKTQIPSLDELLDGGLGKGELGFVIGPSGAGKSWVLARFGTEAVRQGKNVLHFSMELNQTYTGLRYDSCFTGIEFQEVRKHAERIRDNVKHVQSKLNIKYFPQYSLSPASLKLYVDRYQMLTNKAIDLIIVDYADLLRPEMREKNSNSYQDGGSIYGELRGVAGELQIPIWTASQANRSGYDQDIVEAQHVADSFKKIMIADFIMSISRKREDKVHSIARFHIVKNRLGPDGMTFPAQFNTDCGNLQLFDAGSREGMEIQNKMGESDNSVKKLIQNRWNRNKTKTDDE